MIQKSLEKEITRLTDAIKWSQDGLKKRPEGQLLVDRAKASPQYYWRKKSTDNKGEYLGREKIELVKALAQKDYEQRLLKAATQEKERLEKIAARQPQEDVLVATYEKLPEARKSLVEPFVLSDDAFAARWQQVEYAGNSHPFGGYSFFTRRGERVRSKSEVLIANALDAADVPYRYEQPLHLGGYSPVYPDFTALNKRTHQEYYWEHLGGMDDAEYREGALKKLNEYALAGYLLGDKLLVTCESASNPLDTRVIAATIEHYLK